MVAASAAAIRARRSEICDLLAAPLGSWPKYAAQYETDPVGFAEVECGALVDYMAALVETGDANYRQLYIGEKAKQFHDPDTDASVRATRQSSLLDAERRAFHAIGAEVDHHFDAIVHALSAPAEHVVRVLFVGDCLFLDTIAFLTAPLLEERVRIDPIFVASHDVGEISARLNALADERFDLVLFSPLTYAFVGSYDPFFRPRSALSALRRMPRKRVVDDVANVFDTISDLFDCPIGVHLPAALYREDGRTADRVRSLVTGPARNAVVKDVRAKLMTLVASRRAQGRPVLTIDEQALVKPVGLRAAGRYLYRSTVQHPARFGSVLAAHYCDIIVVVAQMLKRKLIVCDLDNTLWDGVIGEGLGVRHFTDRQRVLKELKTRGVVLAINSKNDPAKIVWDGAGHLGLEDFASRQINWDLKTANMARIAQHLNLKPKDFVFVDDRSDELAMMRDAHPAVLGLDATEARTWDHMAIWRDLLSEKAGADRTEFYRQRDARQAFIAADAKGDAERRAESYGKLNLKLKVRSASARDAERATELINRTNQFNMNGARVTRRQIDALIASPFARVIIADAEDRFGSMGTVSALAVERRGGYLVIDAFVLSCRVFGYGMEFAILEAVRQLAKSSDVIQGTLVHTPHNQPCHGVYPAAGFVQDERGWQRSGTGPIAIAPWLNVMIDVPDLAAHYPSQPELTNTTEI